MRKKIDKIKGALYGVAIGDALGATVEFMTADQIQAKYGELRDIVGGGWLNLRPGEVTDDTEMTLCVAEGIVENPIYPFHSIGMRFIKWLESNPRDIGNTCAVAIGLAKRNGQDWDDASINTNSLLNGKSGGNGSLMRTIYPALWYKDVLIAREMAKRISKMTHYDDAASKTCSMYTEMVWHAIRSKEFETRVIWDRVCGTEYRSFVNNVNNYNPVPSGYVIDSFKCALYSILTTYSFESAIVKAVNLGGDADTIGAITGGLAGAMYGYDSIPARWKDHLDQKVTMELDNLAHIAYENQ